MCIAYLSRGTKPQWISKHVYTLGSHVLLYSTFSSRKTKHNFSLQPVCQRAVSKVLLGTVIDTYIDNYFPPKRTHKWKPVEVICCSCLADDLWYNGESTVDQLSWVLPQENVHEFGLWVTT